MPGYAEEDECMDTWFRSDGMQFSVEKGVSEELKGRRQISRESILRGRAKLDVVSELMR